MGCHGRVVLEQVDLPTQEILAVHLEVEGGPEESAGGIGQDDLPWVGDATHMRGSVGRTRSERRDVHSAPRSPMSTPITSGAASPESALTELSQPIVKFDAPRFSFKCTLKKGPAIMVANWRVKMTMSRALIDSPKPGMLMVAAMIV
jgi:hypothetical protein